MMKQFTMWSMLAAARSLLTACSLNNGKPYQSAAISIPPWYLNFIPGHWTKERSPFCYMKFLGGELPPVQLDSFVVPAGKQSFNISVSPANEGLYNLLVKNGPMIPLVNDGTPIKVNIDFGAKDKFYSVSGSAASEQLQDFLFTYSDYCNAIEQSMANLDSLNAWWHRIL